MTPFHYTNNAVSNLASPLNIGDTTLTVLSGDGILFPDSFPFRITIWDYNTHSSPGDDPDAEIVEVVGKSTDTFTITRGKESTSDTSHLAGDKVALLITAGTFEDATYGIKAGINSNTTALSTHKSVADAHHAKYTDAEAVASINADADHGSTAQHNYRTDEEIQDVVNSFVAAGTNVTITYDDVNNTLTIDSSYTNTQLSDEQVQDIVGAFVTAGTNVTVTYDDVANTLTIDSVDTQNIIDSVPVSGNTGNSISSDWAYDHENNAVAHHTNANDPTPDEKAALSGANTPSSTNPFATMDDVGSGSTSPDVIGIEWDRNSSNPTLKYIDIDGNEFASLSTTFFNDHPVWGNIWRCLVDPDTGEVTYGDNARGDGLDLTGASGEVMASIPKFYVKYFSDSQYIRIWIGSTAQTGFEEFPSHVQRGGVSQDMIFISAFEASGILDSIFKLRSATGERPVTGDSSYPNLPNSGRFTIDDAETYANNIGSGFGCMNIWTMAAIRLLFYTEMGSLNSQSALGRGIVDKVSGTGFAGELTGADAADTNIGTNGTGTGTGTDGETPIVYRGIENLWGNVWQFVIGYNAVDSEYRITPRDGTGVLAGNLAAGEYEASIVTPLTDGDGDSNGFQSDVETENLLQYLMIGSETAGSSSTYLCDYYYLHDLGETNILLSGGDWNDGSNAGVGCLFSGGGSSLSGRNFGARFEYIPQR